MIEIISVIVLIVLLTALAWIDFRTFQLPDVLTMPLTAYGLIANSLLGLGWTDTSSALIGCISGYLSLYLLDLAYLKVKRTHGIGMGDAKLLAALGAWFGWQSLPYILVIASATGLAGGYIWLKAHNQELSSAFPFGPFIAIGGLSILIYQWLR